MKNKKSKIVKLINKNPKYKMFIFFGFYIIFFFMLSILIRNRTPYKDNNLDNENTNLNYSFELIEKNNYNYSYNINIDNNIYKYIGKKYNDYEIFNYNNKEYYRDKLNFYENNNGWKRTSNPFMAYKFLDINNIYKFLNVSKFNYKTSYESGRILYNYVISSENIVKSLNDFNIYDNLFGENEISIFVDSNDNVDSITFQLDNYCKNTQLCNNEMLIELKFDSFGKIKEITSPLD